MPNNISIGNAGEYFVAAELERHGFTVAVPMSNVKDFDILAIERTTHKQFAIQVKTTSYKQRKWTLTEKNEHLKGENIVYFFVSLNGLDSPEYHIVPSEVVAKKLHEDHQEWLKKPGIHGQLHNDTNLRNFYDDDNVYLDRWEVLGGSEDQFID